MSYRVPDSANKIIKVHRIASGKNLMCDYAVSPTTHLSLVSLHNSDIPQSIVYEYEELDSSFKKIGDKDEEE